jgi:hypothetical protein
MARTAALGRDIQQWLVRGLEHVAMETPPPETIEVRAMVEMMKSAAMVVLYFDDDGNENG